MHERGGGYRKYYTSVDGFLARTVAYTTARVWAFLLFYDKLNPDPRRTARPDYYIMAGMGGGFLAGVISNPIELVFTRMQVDELYPEQCRRNYRGMVHGLMRACDEGVLLRGAAANGVRIGVLCSSMTNAYDWCKENSYFYLGPSWINRFWATAVAAGMGTAFSMPFDAVRVRMQTMRPLPDGTLPYTSSFDCLNKMM
jgi:solute carrier family 25 oxoglutarate transporter 11